MTQLTRTFAHNATHGLLNCQANVQIDWPDMSLSVPMIAKRTCILTFSTYLNTVATLLRTSNVLIDIMYGFAMFLQGYNMA